MDELKQMLKKYRKIILLRNRDILRKFRRVVNDWDKYIVILEEENEIIIPQKLLNRRLVSKLRDKYLIIDRETTSKYEDGRKITIHFWRIRLTKDLAEIINTNPNLIDIETFIEREVKKICLERCKKLFEEIKELEEKEEELYKELRELEKRKIEEENGAYARVLDIPESLVNFIGKSLIQNMLILDFILENDSSKLKEIANVTKEYKEKIDHITSEILKIIKAIEEKNKKIEEYKRKIRNYYCKYFGL